MPFRASPLGVVVWRYARIGYEDENDAHGGNNMCIEEREA